MNRGYMQNLLLDDIMTNITRDNNLDMIREAVRTYLDIFTDAELEAELIGRGE
jgi:hypothetical protein